MWCQPSPSHRASETELVKEFGIVVADAARQHLPFPGAGWDFKSLELAQDLQRAALVANLRARRHVLPAQQPAHEGGRSDGLDLLAQRPQSKAVNARQQSSFRPF